MSPRVIASVLLAALVFAPAFARRGGKPPTPALLAWAYAGRGTVELLKKPGDAKAVTGTLRQGELAEILDAKTKGGVRWVRLAAADPGTLEEFTGWADGRAIEPFPADRFPVDRKLLEAMGGEFLDDFVAAHAVVVRFLIRRGQKEPLLMGYVGSRALPQVRLQVFSETGGKFVAGPYLSFPYASMGTAIERMEARDLLGDGRDCLISTEDEPSELGSSVKEMVIRRVDAEGFQTLWQAPLELKNFNAYPARPKVLSPAVKNIGQPGTKTTGKVTFERQGRMTVPVWKGEVNFYAVGRAAPVQTVSIDKVCPWNGRRFKPLQ